MIITILDLIPIILLALGLVWGGQIVWACVLSVRGPK